MATKENRTFKFFVNNAWHQPASETYFDSENPSTGQVWAHVPDCDQTDVARAVGDALVCGVGCGENRRRAAGV